MSLERFVKAQEPVYEQVYAELRAGLKQSHWMWFVFPQLRGLGHSSMATHYGIASLEEAGAYLAHAVLGPRLEECTRLLNAVNGRTAGEILGSPDDLKLRSSLTLFSQVPGASAVFADALDKYFSGLPDARTLHLLGR